MTTTTATTTFEHRGKVDHGRKNVSTNVSLSSTSTTTTAQQLSPTMGYQLSRQSFSSPSSPNFLQQPQYHKSFNFDQTPPPTTCQRVNNYNNNSNGQQRPTSASRFGRCHNSVTKLGDLSRPLPRSPSPHGRRPSRPSTAVQTTSPLNISTELLTSVAIKAKDYQSCNHLAPAVRANSNGRKKQQGPMVRKNSSPTSRFFPVLETTEECQQTETTTAGRNFTDRWQTKGDPGLQPMRGARIGLKMNFGKGRDEASPSRSSKSNEECYRMVELRRNILEGVENETGRESVDSDKSVNVRRISATDISRSSPASMRARLSLLGKSLSIDSNSDNPIPCRDFGIRDYLTMTGESIDNEEESSLAGDFGTGLGVIPPRFSIDSIDSQLAILQELKESRNSFSTSSTATSTSSSSSSSGPFKESYRRFSEDIGMLSSAAQRRNQCYPAPPPLSPSSLMAMDMDARNHGDSNLDRIEEDCVKDSMNRVEGRPQLHRSLSIAHPPTLITRSPLPKIREDRCAVAGGSQALPRDSDGECGRLVVDGREERRASGDALMRTWKLDGTLDDADECWQSDDDLSPTPSIDDDDDKA